jgi:hypothetical protein
METGSMELGGSEEEEEEVVVGQSGSLMWGLSSDESLSREDPEEDQTDREGTRSSRVSSGEIPEDELTITPRRGASSPRRSSDILPSLSVSSVITSPEHEVSVIGRIQVNPQDTTVTWSSGLQDTTVTPSSPQNTTVTPSSLQDTSTVTSPSGRTKSSSQDMSSDLFSKSNFVPETDTELSESSSVRHLDTIPETSLDSSGEDEDPTNTGYNLRQKPLKSPRKTDFLYY